MPSRRKNILIILFFVFFYNFSFYSVSNLFLNICNKCFQILLSFISCKTASY